MAETLIAETPIHPDFVDLETLGAASRRVVAWLTSQRATFHPLVEADLARATVLDKSDAGTLAADLAARATDCFDADAFETWVGDRITENGGDPSRDVALGRWLEERPYYRIDAFREAPVPPARDGRRRTLHVGLDLYLPAGSEVFAPCDGFVRGVGDHADPFDYGPTVVLGHRFEDAEGTGVFHTLWGHLDLASLHGLFDGMMVRRGDRVGRLGDAAVNGGWAPHLHVQIVVDRLGRRTTFPGVGAPEDAEIWRLLSPDPTLLLTGLPEPLRRAACALEAVRFDSAMSHGEPLAEC